MNEEQRKLRLKEIEPLKTAIMEATDRAARLMPPLHKPGRYGMERVIAVERALELLSYTDGPELGREFLKLCTDADELWFATKKKSDRGPYDPSLEEIREAFRSDGGSELVAKIKAEYQHVSAKLEEALA